MEMNQWVEKVHNLALEKGWWVDHEIDRELSPEKKLSIHMLVVSEVGEATEEVRNKKPYAYFRHILDNSTLVDFNHPDWAMHVEGKAKPEGEAIELADAVIRIMDYFGFMGWDLEAAIKAKHEYNLTRSLRHGGRAI